MLACIFPRCTGHADQLDAIQHTLQHLVAEVAAVKCDQRAILMREGKIMSDQEHLDADVQALGAGITVVADEITSLKNQPGAPAMDFTGLDAAVAQLQGLAPATTDPGTGDGTGGTGDVPPVDDGSGDTTPVDTTGDGSTPSV